MLTLAPMNQRLRNILSWCDQRHISQQFAFFRGCDPSLEAEHARIARVLRRPDAVTDIDEMWVARMEVIINKLN